MVELFRRFIQLSDLRNKLNDVCLSCDREWERIFAQIQTTKYHSTRIQIERNSCDPIDDSLNRNLFPLKSALSSTE